MTKQIIERYHAARKRLFLLDYDGTLRTLAPHPSQAVPTPETLAALRGLLDDPGNTIVIVSGRPAAEIDAWLGHLPLSIVAEHGSFLKYPDKADWHASNTRDDTWKDAILPLLEKAAAAAPGSFVEQKATALVWHFRRASSVSQALTRAAKLAAELQPLAVELDLRATASQYILEVRVNDADKGAAAQRWLTESWDFILAAGDDVTDEDIFAVLPEQAFSVKVGPGHTTAHSRVPDAETFVRLLQKFIE